MPKSDKLKIFYSFLVLIISIALSVRISTSVNADLDKIGALPNLYLPYLIGVATLLIFTILLLFKQFKIYVYVVSCLLLVNVLTGITLNVAFSRSTDGKRFTYNDSAEDAIQMLPTAQKGKVVIEDSELQPISEGLIFSLSYNPKEKSKQKNIQNHDTVTIKLKNLRQQQLVITNATFSQSGFWELNFADSKLGALKLPITVLPGDSVNLNVKFSATALNKRGKSAWWRPAFKAHNWLIGFGRNFNYQPSFAGTCSIINGQLKLYTDDSSAPVKNVKLSAIWQYGAENDWEPGLQMILQAFHFNTKVGFPYYDNALNGKEVIKGTDEIVADYFEQANKKLPVLVKKIASYHGCCSVNDADTLEAFYKTKKLIRPIVSNNMYSGQTVLPNTLPMSPTIVDIDWPAPFAFKVGSSYTDRNMNFGRKIGIRVWKAVDKSGVPIPDTFIIGSDYLGKKGTNYDYQDNVYLIKNIKPYLGKNENYLQTSQNN